MQQEPSQSQPKHESESIHTEGVDLAEISLPNRSVDSSLQELHKIRDRLFQNARYIELARQNGNEPVREIYNQANRIEKEAGKLASDAINAVGQASDVSKDTLCEIGAFLVASKRLENKARSAGEVADTLHQTQLANLAVELRKFIETVRGLGTSGSLPTTVVMDFHFREPPSLHRRVDLGKLSGRDGTSIVELADELVQVGDSYQLATNLRYVEVPLGDLSEEEQSYLIRKHSLYNLLKATGTSISNNLLTPGTVYGWGSCDHHSGSISGYLVVLDSKYVALVSEYSSDRGTTSVSAEGKFPVDRIMDYEPEWHESWYGNKKFWRLTADDENIIKKHFSNCGFEDDLREWQTEGV
jgi:hypothetical protein